MIPNLPRQLLWTDKMDISDFMSDELGNDVISSYSIAYSSKTIKLGAEIMLKLYNEAFYLSTRVVYEHDAQARPETYMVEIMNDLGDKKMAEHVILLMYMVLMLQSDKSKEIKHFINRLQKEYLSNLPFLIMRWSRKVIMLINNKFGYILKPCPYPADKLKDMPLDWHKITQGYSKKIINELLLLWDSDEEKDKVIRLIELSKKSSRLGLKDKGRANDVNDTHNCDTIVVPDKFLEIMIIIDKADKIIDIINRSLKGKTKNKDKMRPFAAAVAAKVMRAPTWGEIKESCGDTFISKSRYYDYLKKERYSGDGTFDWLKAEFKKILDS